MAFTGNLTLNIDRETLMRLIKQHAVEVAIEQGLPVNKLDLREKWNLPYTIAIVLEVSEEERASAENSDDRIGPLEIRRPHGIEGCVLSPNTFRTTPPENAECPSSGSEDGGVDIL